MQFNARNVSFFVAFVVGSLTTAFLTLLQGVTQLTLLVAFFISFSSSFFLFYFTLELLVFKEINDLYKIVEKLKKKELKIVKKKNMISTLLPIKKLDQEIHSFVHKKQKEIRQLKKMEIYRREFLADVSHELKTPIFAAQGYLHTLLDGAIDDIDVRDKFLLKAAQSLDSLNNLIQDLLTISKMESGFVTMNFKNVDLKSIVYGLFSKFETAALEKNISLELEIDSGADPQIYADLYKITQVFSNLIENGIRYGITNGYVKIICVDREQSILILIEDNGLGIDSEHLDRIFDRFYRIEKSRSKDGGGSGLGLAIVKHILQAHHTEIEVESKPQIGTSFRFELSKIIFLTDEQGADLSNQNTSQFEESTV